MPRVALYKEREQTYVKHFILENYLQELAIRIGFFQSDFVYVDCFSGPWKNNDAVEFHDTSIRIALDKLNYVAKVLKERRRHPRMKAIFVEENPSAFRTLTAALARHRDAVDAIAFPGTFEENIPRILEAVGKSFGFFFVDPKGWTGFDMHVLKPVLNHQPSEVLINFMFDFINRAVNWSNEQNEASFDRCFGTENWRTIRLLQNKDREEGCVQVYREVLRRLGPFTHTTSTRILKPHQDRAYFHLIYATRHLTGLTKFREVEAKAAEEQDRVRMAAQDQRRFESDRQMRLGFEETDAPPVFSKGFLADLAGQRGRAEKLLYDLLEEGARTYEAVLPLLLEERLVTQHLINTLVLEGRQCGRLHVDFVRRQRVLRNGDVIRLVGNRP